MKKLAIVALLVVAAVFGAFVWPTQWRYETLRTSDGDRMIRINRFDSTTQRLTQYGWIDMRDVPTQSAATPLDPGDPYADLTR